MARIIKPQPGPQEQFLSSPADICIYGGAAGGGKSYALLMAAARYVNVKGYGCTIFRKFHNQIFSQGGLWDQAQDIYGGLKNVRGVPTRGMWEFKDNSGDTIARINFSHLERDNEVFSWQGSQLAGLCFDELTHFSQKIFFYMLSRNRSACGVAPFVKATCNPDADSWVAKFIEWWIDQDTGYPIQERAGKLRYFIRRENTVYWADTKEELWEQFNLVSVEERAEPRSVAFVPSSIYDNKELLRINPEYLGNLKALPLVERERLLNGNWKIRPASGLYFKREQIGEILHVVPDDVIQWVRCWDLAATSQKENDDADATAGVLIGKRKNGRYIVADVINKRLSASDVRSTVRFTAELDKAKYKRVRIRMAQDPGQAGREQAQSYIKFLSGFNVITVAETGSKETRAEPMAAQWQAGNFDVLYAPWNDEYFEQLENFPEGKHDDMVDASANAFAEIENKSMFNVSNLI